MAQLPIPIPPEQEQRRIVSSLDRFFGRSKTITEHLARVPHLVERYEKAVLREAFKDVDPAQLTVLDEAAQLVTSGSRGWKKYYSNKGALFIRVGNIRRGSIELDMSDVQRVRPPRGAEGERTRLAPNDIVITITADLGRVGLIPPELGPAYVNQHVCLVRLHKPDAAPLIAWWFTSAQGQAQLMERNRGVTRAGLGLDDIRATRVPSVSPSGSGAVRRIETAFKHINNLAAESARAAAVLHRFKQAALAKAIRGELVPQDPSDEPASVLLEKIQETRKTMPSKLKRDTARRTPTMPKLTPESLKEAILKLQQDKFSFAQLSDLFPNEYENLKTIVFQLLSEPNPSIIQRFDTRAKAMHFERSHR